MGRVVVRGGAVVLPDGTKKQDVVITDGVIEAVADHVITSTGDEIVNAANFLVLPGFIDCHTHFGLNTGKMETLDDFESGSTSAAAGGVTTYINFAPQRRGESLVTAAERELERAKVSLVDYALHLSFGTPGAKWQEELDTVANMGITSMKVYTTYTDTIYYTSDWNWYRLMEHAAEYGILVQVHAENDDLVNGATRELVKKGSTSFQFHGQSRPDIAEFEAVSRGLAFAKSTKSPLYFVHLSLPSSVRAIQSVRQEGTPVFAEVCPHHFSLDDSLYSSHDAKRYVMTPPLRSLQQMHELGQLISRGLVQTVGSDHCGYTLGQRGSDMDFRAASPGIPGTETLWPVLYTTLVFTGLMPLHEAVNLVSYYPATIFGLTPKKGLIAPGYDGDLVLFDPSFAATLDESSLHSRAGYSPWHRREIHGRIRQTISRGETVYQDGVVSDHFGRGQFVQRRRFDLANTRQILGF